MKALQGIFLVAILSTTCHAASIPAGAKIATHPAFKPDIYAQFKGYDIECGHIAIIQRGDEKKCQERCHQYSSLLNEDCNAYTFKEGKHGQESSCALRSYRCRPSNWKKHHRSGLLGGCAYWCGKVPRGVDMSVCRNSDGSHWSCNGREEKSSPPRPGPSQTPKPNPSQKPKPKPSSKPEPRYGKDFGTDHSRRDTADECPARMTACPVIKADGTLGVGLDCVETDQDLNQCGGCLGTGGTDCEKIAHAKAVGCSSGRCKYAALRDTMQKGDTCFRKLGQIVFAHPNG